MMRKGVLLVGTAKESPEKEAGWVGVEFGRLKTTIMAVESTRGATACMKKFD